MTWRSSVAAHPIRRTLDQLGDRRLPVELPLLAPRAMAGVVSPRTWQSRSPARVSAPEPRGPVDPVRPPRSDSRRDLQLDIHCDNACRSSISEPIKPELIGRGSGSVRRRRHPPLPASNAPGQAFSTGGAGGPASRCSSSRQRSVSAEHVSIRAEAAETQEFHRDLELSGSSAAARRSRPRCT